MADYYSVVSQAVSGLPGNTYEARRVLYDRARAALRDTLRRHDPPLSEIALTNEQSAFEAAIRKVEAEWLFNDMRREREEYAALSTQRKLALKIEEMALCVQGKLNNTISIIRDRESEYPAKPAGKMLLGTTKGNFAAALAQGLILVQRTLKGKNFGRSIWLNTLSKRFQSE